MRMKVLRWVGGLTSLTAIGLWFFLGLKGMVDTYWTGPAEPAVYIDVAERGLVLFARPNRMMIVRRPDDVIVTEFVLLFGTHYFGPVWNIDEDSDPWGLRLYFDGLQPLSGVAVVTSRSSPSTGGLPETGGRFGVKLLLSPDSIRLNGSWLKRSWNPQLEAEMSRMLDGM